MTEVSESFLVFTRSRTNYDDCSRPFFWAELRQEFINLGEDVVK